MSLEALTQNLEPTSSKQKLAVIGSGLAGLTIAHLCSISDQYEVILFEKAPNTVGMEAHSKTFQVAGSADGEESRAFRLDTPMRALLDGAYPHVLRMLRYLNVTTSPINFDFIFHQAKPDPTHSSLTFDPSFFGYRTVMMGQPQVKWSWFDLPETPSSSGAADLVKDWCRWSIDLLQRSHLTMEWTRLVCAIALSTSDHQPTQGVTILGYLKEQHYSDQFIHGTAIPFLSIIGSCSTAAAQNYPANVALDVISGFVFGKAQVAQGGVGHLCQLLVKEVPTVKLGCGINQVIPLVSKDLKHQYNVPSALFDLDWSVLVDESGRSTLVNKVVFATQANHTKHQLMANPHPLHHAQLAELVDTLSQFEYEPITVVTHQDPTLLPQDRTQWRANNIVLSDATTNPLVGAMDTIHVDHHQNNTNNDRVDLFQTYNPLIMPNPELTLHVAHLQRGIVTLSSQRAVDRLDKYQGCLGLYFVGAYTYPGLPLLEGCVANAERVARMLNISIPWAHHHPQARDLPLPSRLKEDHLSLNSAYYNHQDNSEEQLSLNPKVLLLGFLNKLLSLPLMSHILAFPLCFLLLGMALVFQFFLPVVNTNPSNTELKKEN